MFLVFSLLVVENVFKRKRQSRKYWKCGDNFRVQSRERNKSGFSFSTRPSEASPRLFVLVSTFLDISLREVWCREATQGISRTPTDPMAPRHAPRALSASSTSPWHRHFSFQQLLSCDPCFVEEIWKVKWKAMVHSKYTYF